MCMWVQRIIRTTDMQHLDLSTVDGTNPANQLRLVVYPVIFLGLGYIPGGCLGFLPLLSMFQSFWMLTRKKNMSCI